jgi:hypothetical protein
MAKKKKAINVSTNAREIEKTPEKVVTPKNAGPILANKIGEDIGNPNNIKEIEARGTAMMQSAQEMMLAIEDILFHEFQLSEKDLRKVEQLFAYKLQTLAVLEQHGYSILTFNDMENAETIYQERVKRLKAADAGIQLPSSDEMEKFGIPSDNIKKKN